MTHPNVFFVGLGFNGFKGDGIPLYSVSSDAFTKEERFWIKTRAARRRASYPQCQASSICHFLGCPRSSPDTCFYFLDKYFKKRICTNFFFFFFHFVCTIWNSWQWTTGDIFWRHRWKHLRGSGRNTLGVSLCLNAGCCNYSFLYEKKMFALSLLGGMLSIFGGCVCVRTSWQGWTLIRI